MLKNNSTRTTKHRCQLRPRQERNTSSSVARTIVCEQNLLRVDRRMANALFREVPEDDEEDEDEKRDDEEVDEEEGEGYSE